LDDTIHQVAWGAAEVLHFVDGHWQAATGLMEIPCSEANKTATVTETLSRSYEPQPDGTLRGAETITVLTNECAGQGNPQGITRVPFVATRIGDVPPGVTLADPALF
jgi:hypothetical protein